MRLPTRKKRRGEAVVVTFNASSSSCGAIRLAAAANFDLMPGRTVTWKGRCEQRSPRYTTRWVELPQARAVG
jgi:hypothetical protein